jgi:hypothetical protein
MRQLLQIHIQVGGNIMECQITVLTSLVCLFLFVIPAFFYIYERAAKMPLRWCTHKTIMLFIAMIICFSLALPALRSFAFLVCR